MHAVSQDEAYAVAMKWPNHRRILPLTHCMAKKPKFFAAYCNFMKWAYKGARHSRQSVAGRARE